MFNYVMNIFYLYYIDLCHIHLIFDDEQWVDWVGVKLTPPTDIILFLISIRESYSTNFLKHVPINNFIVII